MATTSFEDFDVYKKSIILTKSVFDLLNQKAFEKGYAFEEQLKRAVISITNNIAEGSEYNNNKQFIRFLKMSKGSCAEVRSMLFLGNEFEFYGKEEIENSYLLTIEISQQISNFIKYLNAKVKE